MLNEKLNSKNLMFFVVAGFLAFLSHHCLSYLLVRFGQFHYELTTSTASNFAFMILPIVLLSFPAGILADRFNSLTITLCSQIATLLVLIVISMSKAEWLPPLLILYGVGAALGTPSRYILINKMTKPEYVGRLTVCMSLLAYLGMSFAPPIIGLSYHLMPVSGLTLVGVPSLFLLISCFCLFTVKINKSKKHDIGQASHEVHNPCQLGFCLLMAGVASCFVLGAYQVVLPQFLSVARGLDEQSLGWCLSPVGIGYIIGALIALPLADHKSINIFMCTSLTVAGLVLILLTQTKLHIMVPILVGFLGIATSLVTSLAAAGAQKSCSSHNRGRMMSLYSMTIMGGPALGGYILSALADHYSLSFALWLAGTIPLTIGGFLVALVTTVGRRKFGTVKA